MTDYHRLNIYQPARIYTPTTKQELVAAVIEIESNGMKAKAMGTNMSFSAITRSDDCLIETHELNKHLSLPHMGGNVPWVPERFRDGAAVDRLAAMMAPSVLNKHPRLIYVEGGIKIRELLADLAATASPGLALPAMGAGGYQSLAGALATGTHAAENDRQPLADAVRAVHLVGPGGQEWWIERSNNFSDLARVAGSVPDWCADTKIVYDDRLFYSALVSCGRLGVIYAMVLELEAEYWLEERRTKEPYAPVRQQLIQSAQSGFRSATGILTTRGAPGLMFLGIVLNLNTQANCWVMERRIHAGARSEVATQKGSLAVHAFCSRGQWPLPRNISLADLVISILSQNPGASSTAVDLALDEVDGKPPLKIGPSYKVMDQMDYDAPTDCYFGDQSEFFFNAMSTKYLSFVDLLCQFAVSRGGIPGYVNIRFMGHSDGYISMEQFPMTVAIEIVVLKPPGGGSCWRWPRCWLV